MKHDTSLVPHFQTKHWGHLRADFLKVVYFFFMVGYAILKNFSYLFGAKFGDVMTIDQ